MIGSLIRRGWNMKQLFAVKHLLILGLLICICCSFYTIASANPVMTLNPQSFDVSLNIRDVMTRQLQIGNSGDSDLEYDLAGIPPWPDLSWDAIFEYNLVELMSRIGDITISEDAIWVMNNKISAFGSAYIYQLSPDGRCVRNIFDAPSNVNENCGLTWNDGWLYACMGDTFYRLDPETASIFANAAIGFGEMEFLTCNPETGSFYGCSPNSDIYEFTFDGSFVSLIRTIDPGVSVINGLAWDSFSTGGPFLWISYSSSVYQIDPIAGSLTGVTHSFVEENMSPKALCVTALVNPSRVVLCFGTDSPLRIVGVELDEWTPWLSFQPVSGVVSPGDTADIMVTFDGAVPAPGNYNTVTMVQHNSGSSEPVPLPVSMGITTDYFCRFSPENQTCRAEAGFSADCVFWLQNIGSLDDIYTLTVIGGSWPVTFPGGSSVSVAAGDSEEITVRTTIPVGASPGDSDNGMFAAVSGHIPGLRAEGEVRVTCCGLSGTINGVILKSGTAEPVVGVLVGVDGSGLFTHSDDSGAYTIATVPAGSCTVFYSANGYLSGRISGIDVPVHGAVPVNISMVSPEISIDPTLVEVTVPDGDITVEPFIISNYGSGLLKFEAEVSPVGLTSLRQWTDVASTGSIGIRKPAACFGDDMFFVAGGYSDDETSIIYPCIQIFDTVSGIWFESSPMPYPVNSALAEYVDGKVYLIGGYSDPMIARCTVQIYDTVSNTWSLGADMPTPRGGLSGGRIGGMIYCLGGLSSSIASTNTRGVAYAYNIETDSWTVMNSSPEGIYFGYYYSSGCVLDGKVYFLSGLGAFSLQIFYCFDLGGNGTWTALTPPPAGFTSRGSRIVALEPEGRILAFAGESNSVIIPETWSYNPVTNQWTDASRTMTASVWDGAAAVGNSEILYYGGEDAGGTVEPPAFMSMQIDRNSWVSAEPSRGMVAPGVSQQILLSFNAGLAGGPGVYTSHIVISNNDQDEDPSVVNVVMNVGGTPTPCDTTGTRFEISQLTPFRTGDMFWLKVHVCNTGAEPIAEVPVFVILGVGDLFWFWPGWSHDVDYRLDTFPPDHSEFYVLEAFLWPDVSGSADNLGLYCGMVTPELDALIGDYDYITFAYAE